MFVAFVRVALGVRRRGSAGWFSVHLCFGLCSVLDYFIKYEGFIEFLHLCKNFGVTPTFTQVDRRKA